MQKCLKLKGSGMMRNSRKNEKYGGGKTFLRLFPIIFKSNPVFFIVAQCGMGLYGVVLGMTTIITQWFLDGAVEFSNYMLSQTGIFSLLLLLGLIYIVSQFLNGATYVVLEALVKKIEGKLSLKIHEKMNRISPVFFEDTNTLDSMNKALQGKTNAVWYVLSITLVFTYYLPYFTIMAYYLSSVKPLLSLLLLFVFLPILLTHFLRAKLYAKLEDTVAPVRREVEYYEKCMTALDFYKETRTTGSFEFFYHRYKNKIARMNKLSWNVSFKSNMIELGMKVLSLMGYIGILFIMFLILMNGEISVGMFAAVYASIGFMFSFMEELINGHFGAIVRNYGTVQNFLYFMKIPEVQGEILDVSDKDDISLCHVSFSYPGTEKKAIDDVTLTIHRGETVAVVGENGSGKSTLVRLITGIYSPDEGKVLYGKNDTKCMARQCLQKNISAVFQKYRKYQMTLRENITISDVEKLCTQSELDMVCRKAGVQKEGKSFPLEYDTMLSREFDGVELSGGQWQRIAIARGLFREHQIIILDEPTAAIDPIEESKIYENFAEISKDKTAIIVTHRLGSVKAADRVLVMKEGKLKEQGSHMDLMSVDGEYARLYKSQEKWYRQ